MFVILAYDINRKRVSKALKICRKNMIHIQKSVFEGQLTETQLERLKKELERVINKDEDQIVLYRFDTTKYARKEQIGLINSHDYII